MIKQKIYKNYEIFSDGRVFSFYKKRFLKTYIAENGYFCVVLGQNGHIPVHRLMGLVFLKNKLNKPLVCHKDGNKLNNDLKNLYWGTYSENMIDRERHGNGIRGEKHFSAKIKNSHIAMIKNLYSAGITQSELAKQFLINQSQISRIINNKAWKYA